MNFITETLFSLIVIPAFWLLFGIFGIFTMFGFLYALPVLIFLLIFIVSYKRRRKDEFSIGLTLAAFLGQALSLLSWILSRYNLTEQMAKIRWSGLSSIAASGYPFGLIEIPPAPMGNDIPPLAMWPTIFSNHLFWICVGIIASVLIMRYKKPERKNLVLIFGCLALLCLFLNIGLFVLWFD